MNVYAIVIVSYIGDKVHKIFDTEKKAKLWRKQNCEYIKEMSTGQMVWHYRNILIVRIEEWELE